MHTQQIVLLLFAWPIVLWIAWDTFRGWPSDELTDEVDEEPASKEAA